MDQDAANLAAFEEKARIEWEKMLEDQKNSMKPETKKQTIKCSDTTCLMYVSLSFSKLNFFISLLGMVLLATKSIEASEDTLVWLQGMLLALTLIHFCLLAASHFS